LRRGRQAQGGGTQLERRLLPLGRRKSGVLAGRVLLSFEDRNDKPVTGGVDLRAHEGILVGITASSYPVGTDERDQQFVVPTFPRR
jgi:hypothetical protein